jgi:TPR repeat protein
LGYHVAAYNAAWLLHSGRAHDGMAPGAGYARAARIALAHAEADGSDTEEVVLLARQLDAGLGVPRDEEAAARWYRHAADRGSSEGAFAFAVQALQGRGVPADRTLARQYFARVAADAAGPWLLGDLALAWIAVCDWWAEPSAMMAAARTAAARASDIMLTGTLLAVLVVLRVWWGRQQ